MNVLHLKETMLMNKTVEKYLYFSLNKLFVVNNSSNFVVQLKKNQVLKLL